MNIELTEHEIRLIRRGLKALHYDLEKKARRSTFVPAPGGKDITKLNLAAVEALLERVRSWQRGADT